MKENRILWLPWGSEAFQKAKSDDKPVLLDISAVWCHWCHVMEETTYSDPEVADLVMRNCVPVKVDRDQRPDIDKRYNLGGWPTTAFLTPTGKIITGGTYIPPQQMRNLIREVHDYYKKNKKKIEAETEEAEKLEAITAPLVESVSEEDLGSAVDNVVLTILASYDQTYGGFGFAPKFPNSEALAFSLLECHLKGQKALLNIVTTTLSKMQEGGINDKIEGGFFRYSTTRDWSIPHYEKMCEDNAKLLVNYLQAFQVTQDEPFKATAQKTLNYVDANLCDRDNGGFYGSQDADEEYYKLSRVGREKRVKPKVDKTIFTNYNAMMISAYLLASSVLEDVSYKKFAIKTVRLLLKKCFKPNDGMCHFIIDGERHLSMLLTDQVYMIRALIDAFEWTQNRAFLQYAESIAGSMLQKLWSDEGGFSDRPVTAEDLGMLRTPYSSFDENAVASDALLRLHHLTGNDTYRNKALATLRRLFLAYRKYEVLGSSYGMAVELYLHPVQVQIVGSPRNALTKQLVREALIAYNPLKTIEVIDPKRDLKRLKVLNYPVSERAKAYVCAEGKCTLAENAADLTKLVGLDSR